MNVFAIIILTSLVLEFFLELTGNLLNLKSLKLELPPVLRDVYKPEEYLKSQDTHRPGRRIQPPHPDDSGWYHCKPGK